MMSNGDREGRIFRSHPHTNNSLFFLLTTISVSHLILEKTCKRLPEDPEFGEMRNGDIILTIAMTSRVDVRPMCGCSFFIFPIALSMIKALNIK